MTTNMTLCAAALLLAGALPAAAPAAAPRQDEAPAARDAAPDLKALEDALAQRKSGKEEERAQGDAAVVAAIDVISSNFAQYDEKTQKKVAGEIGGVFKVRTPEEENSIYVAAAAALSEMGEAGQNQLEAAFKVKNLEKRIDVQETLIEALARHKDPKNVDMFLKLFREPEDRILVAATRALGEYRDADAKVRKEIVEQLVKEYANVHNLDAKERGTNPVWHERKLAIEVPMNEALAALTLQSFQSAPEWEAWYNDNRNKKW